MVFLAERARLLGVAGVIALGLSACAPTVTVHGYAPSQTDLESIEPGIDTIFSLEERIGRPSTSGLLREQSWYYVQTTISQLTYNPPEVTDRVVVAVAFDDDGIVQDVQRYGLEDGRVVNLSPRVTETSAKRLSILEQIFGNLVNFNAADILADR